MGPALGLLPLHLTCCPGSGSSCKYPVFPTVQVGWIWGLNSTSPCHPISESPGFLHALQLALPTNPRWSRDQHSGPDLLPRAYLFAGLLLLGICVWLYGTVRLAAVGHLQELFLARGTDLLPVQRLGYGNLGCVVGLCFFCSEVFPLPLVSWLSPFLFSSVGHLGSFSPISSI